MEKKEIWIPSTDGLHRLHGYVYRPEGEAKASVQVVHGMAEHIERYDGFMTALAEAGYLVFGHDHIGHGQSVRDESELGFFASRDGWELLTEDIHRVGEEVRKEEKPMPRILFGHSMGSFLVRLAAARYPESLDKLIVMGTGGVTPGAGAGVAVGKMIRFFRGEKHVSKLMYRLAFGSYNRRTEKETDFDWLSFDRENVRKYLEDPLSGFFFTVSGMIDLIEANRRCNEDVWYEAMPKDLPVLLVAGCEDPVGAYGAGPAEVQKKLADRGAADVRLILYPDGRHEILNDRCAKQTVSDILAFIRETVRE